MSLIITVIAGPCAGPSLADVVASIAEMLHANADWLAPNRACDLAVDGVEPKLAETAARRAIGNLPVDVVVQPAAGRRKRIFVADLESTIIDNEMLDDSRSANSSACGSMSPRSPGGR